MRPPHSAEPIAWLEQAQQDLGDGRALAGIGSHASACFFAQQAAEKALKGVLTALGEEPWGHSVADLLEATALRLEVPEHVAGARALDAFYIPTRYPNALPAGSRAADVYGEEQSSRALELAEGVVAFVAQHIER